jgi:hypothetical protein
MYPVKNDAGKVVGFIWQGSMGRWIAAPNGSSIQNIPCETVIDAAKTVKRLGRVQVHPFEIVT